MEGRHVPLKGEWRVRRAADVEAGGERVSQPDFPLQGWMPARVPGTILGALVDAGVYADPWAAEGGEGDAGPAAAPDASAGEADLYTYWWVRDFELAAGSSGQRFWLDFPGINYRAEVFVNGRAVEGLLAGMFQRHSLDVTHLARNGGNRVAVRVRPPWPPGTPEAGRAGGRSGPGSLASSVTMRYTAGWDWMPPVADRNTGLWQAPGLRITGPIRLNDPRVVTYVLGPEGEVTDKATLMMGAEVHNASDEEASGMLTAHVVDTGRMVERALHLPPGERTQVALPDVDVTFPHLWWPSGMGDPGARSLYTVELLLNVNGVLSDLATVRFGIREVGTRLDEETGGRVLQVNGRDIFTHAADWIGTDALLRQEYRTPGRYRDEVRLHAEAGVNLLRVWGGGIVEAEEFYAACDELGVMVIQDFPRSGEYTGPYPDEHEGVFMASARDCLKRLRNHPSLVLWSGGNEVPEENLESWQETVDHCLRCHVTGRDREGDPCRFTGASPCDAEGVLDGTRPYVASSRSAFRGMVELELPHVTPTPRQQVLGDGLADGVVAALDTQRVVEAARCGMWHPHTGLRLGKLHGPWPGMEGTLYDWSLQQGGGYFGVRRALRPLQVVHCGAAGTGESESAVRLLNSLDRSVTGTLRATAHDPRGRELASCSVELTAEPGGVSPRTPLPWDTPPSAPHFLTLDLEPPAVVGDEDPEASEDEGAPLARNRYWRPAGAATGSAALAALDKLPWVELEVEATVERLGREHRLTARLRNPESEAVAFGVQVLLLRGAAGGGGESVADATADRRILPAFYSDNYFTLLPGEERQVVVTCTALGDPDDDGEDVAPALEVGGWNVDGTRPFGE